MSGKMFDFCIGNPPYQDNPELGSTRSLPVYDTFMDAAYNVSDKVLLITPARFLFNAGQTKKSWNKKMLSDPHFKVLYYEQDSSKIFPTTDISAGVAITYHDNDTLYKPIGIFIKEPELRSILEKVGPDTEQGSLTAIAESQNNYDFDVLYRDHPDYSQFISGEGHHSQLKSNALSKVPIFSETKHSENDLRIFGLVGGKRGYKYCPEKYIRKAHKSLMSYKVLLPEAGGSGEFGELLSESIIAGPKDGFTQTFFSLGSFDNVTEAENLAKYVKTKLSRSMLGILKVTQHKPPIKWRYVPIQDFTPSSDIDWTKSVHEIDLQLYRKYGLSVEEINFIETHVKEMV